MLNKEEVVKREKRVSRMQKNLRSLRNIAGWSERQFGEKIGVSRQTINNLENNRFQMNYTQYIAIRTVLDCEIAEHPENTMLPKAVHMLLDSEDMDDEDYRNIEELFDMIASTAACGADTIKQESVFSKILPVLGGIAAAALIGTAAIPTAAAYWLLKDGDKEENKVEENKVQSGQTKDCEPEAGESNPNGPEVKGA